MRSMMDWRSETEVERESEEKEVLVEERRDDRDECRELIRAVWLAVVDDSGEMVLDWEEDRDFGGEVCVP